MGRIIQLSDELIKKSENLKPDFHIFTAGIESDRKNPNIVHMIGSSTEQDMQGDTMTIYALHSMTKAAPNMTIWLNHDYTLPDSIFGSVLGTPVITHQDGVADLHLSVDVEMSNPAAARVKKYIDNGRRLGCSIGCMVTKAEVADESDGAQWFENPINILEVYVVEYSVVGIPCNQRSWVENAIRGVFTRTLDPSLAPAMQALWPTTYKQIVKSADASVRERLASIPAREKPDARLEWHVPSRTFMLSQGKQSKSLTSEQIKALFRDNEDDMRKKKNFTLVTEEAKDVVEIKQMEENEADGSGDDTSAVGGDLHTDRIDDKTEEQAQVEEEKEEVVEPQAEEGVEEEEEQEVSLPAEEITVEHREESEVNVENSDTNVEKSDVPPHILALLDSYNMLGKSLQFPEVTVDHYKKAEHPALQKTKGITVGTPQEHAHSLQILHDMMCGLNVHPHSSIHAITCCYGASCPTQGVPQAAQQAQEAAVGSSYYNSLGEKVEVLSKSIDTYSTFVLDITKARKEHELATKELEAARKEVNAVSAEIMAVQRTIKELKDMPLGNPLTHRRSVHAEDSEAIATREDFIGIEGSEQKSLEDLGTDSLTKAFSLTTLKSEVRGGMALKYRLWPKGVGGTVEKGVRPELTSNQISFMDFNDIQAYRAGEEARVPLIDNQIQKG